MASGEKGWAALIVLLELWRKQSIYRVPASVKDLNSQAYKPQVVSFGPFHYGEAQLMRMEEYKHRALLHFLRRPENVKS